MEAKPALKLTAVEPFEETPPPTNMQEALALLEEAKARARRGVQELISALKNAQEVAEDVARGAALLPSGVNEEGRQLSALLTDSIQRLTALDQRNGGAS